MCTKNGSYCEKGGGRVDVNGQSEAFVKSQFFFWGGGGSGWGGGSGGM